MVSTCGAHNGVGRVVAANGPGVVNMDRERCVAAGRVAVGLFRGGGRDVEVEVAHKVSWRCNRQGRKIPIVCSEAEGIIQINRGIARRRREGVT